MTIKKSYYYLFYKIYTLIDYTSEKAGGKFLTDFKATLIIIALEILCVVSILNYYNIYIDKAVNFPRAIYIYTAIFFALFNYTTFTNHSDWKKNNKHFDSLPKEVNKRGTWIVFGIILFIIINFIFSVYLVYRINNN